MPIKIFRRLAALTSMAVVAACSTTTTAAPVTTLVGASESSTSSTLTSTLTSTPSSTSTRATSTTTSTTTLPTTTTTTLSPTLGLGPHGSGPGINVYAHTLKVSDIDPKLAKIPTRVYVPNQGGATLDEIDPTTYKVVSHFDIGKKPQHVVAQWDLGMLYATTSGSNTLTPIDPLTGAPQPAIPITDAYNLYFSPDGTKAIVMVEAYDRIDTYDWHTWKKLSETPTGCRGVNHADFTPDGKIMLASCEFSGDVIRVDLDTMKVTGMLHLGGMTIDVKLSPDGTVFFVANEMLRKVSVVDLDSMKEIETIPTDLGTHGVYPSRDATKVYATNRSSGTVTVIDIATRKVITTWRVGGSPDMGAVSADGKEFWISGRYNGVVYVIDTTTGVVTHTIPVGNAPHGLTIFPLPGRYSMGHTDNYR